MKMPGYSRRQLVAAVEHGIELHNAYSHLVSIEERLGRGERYPDYLVREMVSAHRKTARMILETYPFSEKITELAADLNKKTDELEAKLPKQLAAPDA